MEQNFGPHMEQKCAVLDASAGSVSSWNAAAVCGSSDNANWSTQRNSNRAVDKASSQSLAPGCPFATSAACAESVERRTLAPVLLEDHVLLDKVERHVTRSFDHDLDVVGCELTAARGHQDRIHDDRREPQWCPARSPL